MNLSNHLAMLTDSEAERCLSRILSGVKATAPESPYGSEEAVSAIFADVVQQMKLTDLAPKLDKQLSDKEKAIRVLLVEMAEVPALQGRVAGALDDLRTKRDPITLALVMSGIVLLLSTRVDVKVNKKAGGTLEYSVALTKNASSEGLIKKILEFFR